MCTAYNSEELTKDIRMYLGYIEWTDFNEIQMVAASRSPGFRAWRKSTFEEKKLLTNFSLKLFMLCPPLNVPPKRQLRPSPTPRI